MFSTEAFQDHEQVVFCSDQATGLRAIIALHDTTLGPAIGGTRVYSYASEAEALRDVLRLSAGMTAKAAAAGLNYGGGKAVIIADPARDKTPALLRAYGRAVERLGGRFLTAEDIGINERDMALMREETTHVMGLPVAGGGSGDPSPTTALGVLHGMKAAAAFRWGSADLAGRTIAIQGLGNVGWHLSRLLHAAGARLLVADMDAAKVEAAAAEFGAGRVAPDRICGAEADIFAPCAMGAALNPASIAELKVAIVAGGANNQLADAACGDALLQRGILYAPDFVINAGGMIRVVSELGRFDLDEIERTVAGIGPRLRAIFERAGAEGRSPDHVARRMAAERVARAAA